MLKTKQNIAKFFCISAFLTLNVIADSYAACSPGIPCTTYDIYSTTGANAPKSGDSGSCDSNFMNQIYSKAFLEANREVIMAGQLIHKPDSVLEYTCFDQFIAKSAHAAGPIFSETQEWATGPKSLRGNEIETDTADDDNTGTEVLDTPCGGDCLPDQSLYVVFELDRLDHVLEDFLLETLEEYIDGSFSHTFLGEGTTIDNNLNTTNIGANAYNCSHMSTVWSISKCLDFGEDDRFRSLKDLINADPRSIPTECSPNIATDTVLAGSTSTKLNNTNAGLDGTGGFPITLSGLCPPPGGLVAGTNTGMTNDQIRLANNCDTAAGPNAFATFDTMATLNGLIKGYGIHMRGAASSADPNVTMTGVNTIVTCSDPLPTGVPVVSYTYSHLLVNGIDTVSRTTQVHYDHLCPNLGCYYQPNKVGYVIGALLPATTTGICIPY